MIELACALFGHVHRADICQKAATSFFKTAKGTLWPLCPACCERHKTVGTQMFKKGRLPTTTLTQATFDIPIDDAESLAAFRAQDPSRIQGSLDRIDKLLDAAKPE